MPWSPPKRNPQIEAMFYSPCLYSHKGETVPLLTLNTLSNKKQFQPTAAAKEPCGLRVTLQGSVKYLTLPATPEHGDLKALLYGKFAQLGSKTVTGHSCQDTGNPSQIFESLRNLQLEPRLRGPISESPRRVKYESG